METVLCPKPVVCVFASCCFRVLLSILWSALASEQVKFQFYTSKVEPLSCKTGVVSSTVLPTRLPHH
jgi:hypothetical protein